jgi:hypothetical protein
MKPNASLAQCCFCGNKILKEGSDPVVLTLDLGEPEEEGQQSLFSHYRCLKRALDPSVPLFPIDGR